MTLSPTIEAMFAAALKRIYRRIDERAQLALGRPQSTVNRSISQLHGAKVRMQREYDDACLRG